jgi:hypothetical protein
VNCVQLVISIGDFAGASARSRRLERRRVGRVGSRFAEVILSGTTSMNAGVLLTPAIGLMLAGTSRRRRRVTA